MNRAYYSPQKGMTKKMGVFLLYFFLIAVGCAIGAAVSGCASVSQAAQTYGAVAVADAQAANDTIIAAQKATFCGLPYSAIVRHPEIIPAVRSMCVATADANGNALLDAAVK